MIEKIQIVHNDFRESLERLSYESIGRLFMALIAYANDEDYAEHLEGDVQAQVLFPTIKAHIIRQEDFRQYRVEAGRKGGKMGGAPVGNQNASKTKQIKAKQSKTKQNKPPIPNPIPIPNPNIKYIVEILSYLNERAGTKFGESKETVRLINARILDGFTVDDFKKVIDKKVKEWKGTDRAMYIRPSTLFAPSHFEEYLNAPEGKSKFDAGEHCTDPFKRFTQRDIDFDELSARLIKN